WSQSNGGPRFENSEFTVRIYPGALAEGTIYCPISARKTTSAAEAIERVIERLRLDRTKCYVLAEVKEFGGEEWILNPTDCPVQRMMLWPRVALEHRPLSGGEDYRFLLRQKNLDGSIHYGGSLHMWLQVTEERRRMMERGLLPQPEAQGDHADLCCLPELNERTLLDNLRSRFRQEKIYTYVGSILIVINPFKFLPIYNPKYVKMYDNHTLGDLEPHIYAVADVAYHAMLQRQSNQCIVISGESGSGKTQSTNFLIHHLTALSQKGFASGVEQIILGAGPVLEAFGNAKTAHNNNSSRFGKFIQVNYQESGTVRGAYVEKYLLEKSRLVYQEHNERNYHVFYYLLAGASEEERTAFHLKKPEEYHYLSQVRRRQPHWDSYCDSEPDCFTVEGEDLKHDFERLQLAMEMVGFLPATRKQIFCLLSAILHLGNIRYKRKTYRDDSIDICNPEVLPVVSELLEVKEEMLFEALTTRKTVTVGEKLIVPYKLSEAGTVRDSMAKSLYSALFDWIVFRINHALLNIRDLEETTKILSIGVLDIFGFEDYENNSFEQFCINFANERLQHYFNQHTFKLEQEEYRSEGISWRNIDYIDNTGCINLISKKPTALFHLLDEECNFPQATNQTLLDKFKRQHEGNGYIEFPAVMEPAFIIQHYAGKVKYGVKDFREKNTDHMRPDVVALLKSSKSAFICGLMGIDPSATFRWAVLRAYFRALVAFREAGRRHTLRKSGHDDAAPCAVLKSVDSFSFLQHPVHQRSLEILQRCKEEKHSKAANLTETQTTTTGGDGGGVLTMPSCMPGHLRNKNYKSKPVLPKHLLNVKSLKYLSNLTLHDRITKSLLHLHKKKKPPSISAQFQASLNKLMETLGQSEPYFVKCIRSNAEKLPLRFNDNLVLRQLRYTGMLETVRIRQSGYNVKYSFKDFVRHFSVLLPEGTRPTKEGIQRFLRRLDLQADGYQVGKTQVFLREAERQRLQALLHGQVFRLIVTLQRRFRARLERKQFVRMRRAAVCIQTWWRSSRSAALPEDPAPAVREAAALCLQTRWRGYRERRKFVLRRRSALVLQRAWRAWRSRRGAAALVIQTAWRCHRAREDYLRLHRAVVRLQAASRGFLTRRRSAKEQRLREEEEGRRLIMGLDLSTWEDRSYEQRENSLQILGGQGEGEHERERTPQTQAPAPAVVVRERVRSLDEPNQKTTRAKRESRRMRELEQAKFSLELLKVRANSGGASSPSEERRWSAELVPPATPPLRSPQGTPDSQSSKGSFELLMMDEEPPKAEEEVTDGEDAFSPLPPAEADPGAVPSLPSAPTHPPKFENYLPTFYVPAEESRTAEDPRRDRVPKPVTERREAVRRPVPTRPGPAPDPPGPTDPAVMEKLVRLNEVKEERQRSQRQKNEKEMMEQIRQQKEALEQQRLVFAQYEREMFEKQRGEALHRIQQSRQPGPDPPGRPLRPRSLLIDGTRPDSAAAPPPQSSKLPPPPPASASRERRHEKKAVPEGWAPRLTLESRDGAGTRTRTRTGGKKRTHAGLQASERSQNTRCKSESRVLMQHVVILHVFNAICRNPVWMGVMAFFRVLHLCKNHAVITCGELQVGRVGQKKKARMARTRSDFLTRAPVLSVGGDSDEDDYGGDGLAGPRHFTLPLSKQGSTEAGLRESCFSDSDMVTFSEEQKKLHKTMSSGDLGKSDSMRKNSQDGRVRKMRFWGRPKYGEKKTSREKSEVVGRSPFPPRLTNPVHATAGQENMSPPCSPDSTLDRGSRDLKENKEPSPKVKRRRSVKISSVALEPAPWQNDSLQILTCTNDYRSMNDFLMKKINDLDTEDSKKDTLVDVVFKKALKEFRLNIFNSYSTALAMDDGKSIRYKDLHALFEHILEKTMRQEQRDWRESPVKVWVNTFKVFLDEFMTEYKPQDGTLSKAPKPERKKRRKKDADIVEEHNGHIFKSTQYSIPTYCEFCSSLIWMMDRACVCKLCRYACHRKCCQKTTTKCSKKFDPELSSRQFGVEVSRLTNDERTVPLVVEKLINYIEMHGLYTEGIYRKSGSTNKIKELKQGLDTDVESMNLDDYNIHVIGSVFKQWLRELPNPLMTFELYEEFIRAMGLQDKKEMLRGVYSVIDQLSRTHLNTLERLMFHLVRISLQEDTNRMSANALAIVFAPCILRCPDSIDPLQSVQDISKTTACVELIICEQMNKYKVRLKDINTLEFAESKAKSKLTLIRRSMVSSSSSDGKGHLQRSNYLAPSPPVSPRLPSVSDAAIEESGGEEAAEPSAEMSEHQQVAMQQEERVLTEQIESLQKEKEELTFEMLTLEPRASDDETLESEASIGTADSSENLNVDSEDTISDFSGASRPRPRSHVEPDLNRQPSSASSSSAATSRRFRFHSRSSGAGSSPTLAQPRNASQASRSDSSEVSPTAEAEYEDRPHFSSRGTYNPEKGKQKLRGARQSTLRHSRDGGGGGGSGRDPPDIPQHMVLYGNNEFMV
uniref:Myosin IXAa n=1 Tax=Salarias fasciatus TaxID=181472 RepID=A0A672JR19_SALFA